MSAEDLLTVASIHTEKREIRLVRIGSNFTMNMKERTYTLLNIKDKNKRDKTLIYPHLYCMHFVLDLIWKCGLFAEHGLKTLLLWEQAVDNEKSLKRRLDRST